MNLLTMTDVMKQYEKQTILKHVSLTIQPKARIGLKMKQLQAVTLFDLIENRLPTSSGTLDTQAHVIMSDRKSDQLYENLTVKKYLSTFQKIAGETTDLPSVLKLFSLIDIADTRIKRLTLSQQKRISLARLFLFKPDIILIESSLSDFSNEGIELYLRSLAAFDSLDSAIIFTANHLEDLLLTSQDIFQYDDTLGLGKTDITTNEEPFSELSTEDSSLITTKIVKISSKIDDKTIFFDPFEIDFIESINSTSTISIDNEKFPSNLTMNELESQLAAFGFFRCHRSYLVNLQRVSELISYSRNSFTLILKGVDASKLPLSRSRLDDFKKIMTF